MKRLLPYAVIGAVAADLFANLWTLREMRKREKSWGRAVVEDAEKVARDGASTIGD